MGAVVREPSDLHRKVVALSIEGRSRAEIARACGYSCPQAVTNVLRKPHVREYHRMVRERLLSSLTDADRVYLSDLVEFEASPLRRVSG